jgi:RHS repeat-associated protein
MSTTAATSIRCLPSARRAAALVIVLVSALGATATLAQAQAPPEAVEYYATDALGSVRVVYNSTGQVLGRSDYLPFGETLNQSGALPRQRFTGQERDGEAGLDYFNARNLQARTGRMNAPDPLFGDAMTSPQRWNRYAYVVNSPLRFTDPSGMQFKTETVAWSCSLTNCVSLPPLTSWNEFLSYLPGFIGVSLQEFSPEYLERIANRELAKQARKDGQQAKTRQAGPATPLPGPDGPGSEKTDPDEDQKDMGAKTGEIVKAQLCGLAVGTVQGFNAYLDAFLPGSPLKSWDLYDQEAPGISFMQEVAAPTGGALLAAGLRNVLESAMVAAFRPGGWLNSNRYLRIGWGRHGGTVFRVSGNWVKTQSGHIDLYGPCRK